MLQEPRPPGWKTIFSKDGFRAAVEADKKRPKLQQRPMDTIALVSLSEKSRDFSTWKNVFTIQTFGVWLRHVDESRCGASVQQGLKLKELPTVV
eukprot:4013768-Pyramimonas_sp.AAC.1